MIIQAARLKVGVDLAALTRHIFAGPANEEIEPLYGGPDDLAAMVADAKAAGKTYAIRHLKVSPAAPMSRTDLGQLLCDLGSEFGFLPDRCVTIEHRKPRVGGAGYDRHWHVLVEEWDPVRRRVLSSHWMRPRHEKIARVAELRLGHAPVIGRWNAAVTQALSKAGDAPAAAEVSKLASVPRPESSYPARRHQAAARRGIALPQAKAALTTAWEQSASAAEFIAAVHERGMTVRVGDKDQTWIIETNAPNGGEPVLAGALHRLLRQPKHLVADRMGIFVAEPVSDAANILHAEPEPIASQGGGDGRASHRENKHVKTHGDVHDGRHRKSGKWRAEGRTGQGTRSDGEEGVDTNSVRQSADGNANRPPHGTSGCRHERGGTHAGRSNRELARESCRSPRATECQALRDRVRTRQALRLGPQPSADRIDRIRSLLDRMDSLAVRTDTDRRLEEPLQSVAGRSREALRQRCLRLPDRPRIWIGWREPLPDTRMQRRRWIAACLRQAYNLDWVPESVTARIVAVDWIASDKALVLTLDTGTLLVDRFDRIDVVGNADDVAVSELVACVRRRGWQAVRLFGSDQFRVDAACALLAAGIQVEDPPVAPEVVIRLAHTQPRHRSEPDQPDVPLPP